MTDLERLIDALASAILPKGRIAHGPTKVTRDPAWKRHRAEARAAAQGRDLCAYRGCLRACGDPDEPWCWRHSPDEVAIERAVAGERVNLWTHEREEALRRLVAAGASAYQAADRLGLSRRHVERQISTIHHDDRSAA